MANKNQTRVHADLKTQSSVNPYDKNADIFLSDSKTLMRFVLL